MEPCSWNQNNVKKEKKGLCRVANRSTKGVWGGVTSGGDECCLALFTGSSFIHSFDVKQIVFIGLQENFLLTALDT